MRTWLTSTSIKKNQTQTKNIWRDSSGFWSNFFHLDFKIRQQLEQSLPHSYYVHPATTLKSHSSYFQVLDLWNSKGNPKEKGIRILNQHKIQEWKSKSSWDKAAYKPERQMFFKDPDELYYCFMLY